MAEARKFSPERPGQLWGRFSLLLLGYRGYFQAVKRPERAAGHLPMFSCDIKNESRCTCTAIKWLHGDHRVGPSNPWTRINPSYTDVSGSGFISNTLHIKRSPMSVVSHKVICCPPIRSSMLFLLRVLGSIFEPRLGNWVPWNKFYVVSPSSSKAHIYSSATTTSIRSYIVYDNDSIVKWSTNK